MVIIFKYLLVLKFIVTLHFPGKFPAFSRMVYRIFGSLIVYLMEEKRGAYRVLVERPEGKRPLGRPRCRRKDFIYLTH
jgi:hypothetical protein